MNGRSSSIRVPSFSSVFTGNQTSDEGLTLRDLQEVQVPLRHFPSISFLISQGALCVSFDTVRVCVLLSPGHLDFITSEVHRAALQVGSSKSGLNAIRVPEHEPCKTCQKPMTLGHRINNEFDVNVRVLWKCEACARHEWKQYGFGPGARRHRQGRWH
jgi:hypothetical protein